MQQTYCLIADKMHESIVPLLSELGFEVHYRPEITRKELLATIEAYAGLIIRSKTEIDREVISQASKLKFLARAGAGIDQLDVAILNEKNIVIINAPEGNRDALGEHAVGMLLCLFNKIVSADRQVRSGVWSREANRGIELMGKTVGLIGFGNMGQAFAKRLAGFGCKIIAYDKYHPNFRMDNVSAVDLKDIFEFSDVVSLHVPLTGETRGMFSEAFVDKFKKPFYFLNTARGEIAPYSTILNGLKSRKILGAALDVLENEKINQLTASQQISFDELARLENVLFTPHVAGWTFQSYEKINLVLVEKIRKLSLFPA